MESLFRPDISGAANQATLPTARTEASITPREQLFAVILETPDGLHTIECGRDEYLLAGRRLDDTTIEERWRVRGPDKDYEITTTLVRA